MARAEAGSRMTRIWESISVDVSVEATGEEEKAQRALKGEREREWIWVAERTER